MTKWTVFKTIHAQDLVLLFLTLFSTEWFPGAVQAWTLHFPTSPLGCSWLSICELLSSHSASCITRCSDITFIELKNRCCTAVWLLLLV